MTEINQLEPCPYCWKYKGEITEPEINQTGGSWWAICPACLYSIAAPHRGEVIELWNRGAHLVPRGEQ